VILKVLDYYCDHQVQKHELSNHNKRNKVDACWDRFRLMEVIEVNFGPPVVGQYYENTKECLSQWVISRRRHITRKYSLRVELHSNKHVCKNENKKEYRNTRNVSHCHDQHLQHFLKALPAVSQTHNSQ